MTERKDLPVGVFDSGVGGVSVLRALVRHLPGEDFYFFGDSAHAPYGTKSVEEIRELTLSNVEHMCGRGIKALVVACNTATSAAISLLREKYTMPVIGIEPALKPASMLKEHPRVLIMATPMTVRGAKFHDLAARFSGKADILPVECPGLMEFAEAGILEGSEVEACVEKILRPYLHEPADAVVLGCTHYPFLKNAIRKVVGADTAILDGSDGTARELARRLAKEDLLSGREQGGTVTFEMTVKERESLARRLLMS